MKLLLLSAFTMLALVTIGQKHPYSLNTVKNEFFRQSSDSIAVSIEKYREFRMRSDSVNLYSPGDMTEVVGLYTEQFFYDSSNQLRKVITTQKEKETETYYFQDTSLIKVVVVTQRQNKEIVYYFSRGDNTMSKYLIERLMQKAPEYADWLKKLLMGKNFMEEHLKR